MTGLAAKLKPAGYATHLIGKWDCGMSTVAHLPAQRGFDTVAMFFSFFFFNKS